MMQRFLGCICAVCLLAACAGKESVKVTELQKKDKGLSCKEIKLEVNEAEYYKKAAENNKTPGVQSLLMPLGYVSTYVDAEEAQHAAQARVDYLNRIYDILKCDQQDELVAPQQGTLPQVQRVMPVTPQPAPVILHPVPVPAPQGRSGGSPFMMPQ